MAVVLEEALVEDTAVELEVELEVELVEDMAVELEVELVVVMVAEVLLVALGLLVLLQATDLQEEVDLIKKKGLYLASRIN